jgi:general secretion pathway protein G
MNVKQRRGGFTLIEVLIVVVIMAVLAATIIPQFTSSAKDARESSVKFNLHSLRGMIEMYKTHHQGGLPSGANNLEQLTSATNQAGAVGTAGPTFPYGPYLQRELPTNPFTNGNKVTLHTGAGAPTASGTTDAGWIYRPATGDIWIDHADYLNE